MLNWETRLVFITVILTLAIAEAPTLAQWVQDRSSADLSMAPQLNLNHSPRLI